VTLSPRVFLPRILFAPALAVFLLTAAGCSDPALVPVSGKVTVDNKPLKSGNVLFVPDRERGNIADVEPRSLINESGVYELTTNGKPGAPPGWYKVAVAGGDDGPANEDNSKPKLGLSPVPEHYNDPEKTDLRVEVKADGSFDLNLSGAGGTPQKSR
jgi:hypothetical protein